MTMMNTSRSLAAALLVCALLLSATVGSATAKKIALVYDSDVAEIHEDEDRTEWGEARNVRAFLVSLYYSPYLITDYYNEAGWNTTLANARTVIFPEGAPTVPSDSVEPIRAWVSGGGVAVFVEDTEGVARQLTGLSLGGLEGPTKRGSDADPWPKTTDGEASSLFANGPAELVDLNSANGWNLDGDLPGEAADLECMYGTTDDCAVWVYTQGSGSWFGVAPDFYDFGYAEGQDGGWVSVMTTIAAYGSSSSSASRLTSWVTHIASSLL
jgi:hypothetical protein